MEIKTNSPQETKRFASKFVNKLKGGRVLGLVGELGTGKTVFVQGLAEALGVKEIVNSPTFVLMKVYKTENLRFKTLVHVDAYRLDSFDQLKEIGVEEYLNKDNYLVVIEWANKIPEIRKYSNYHEVLFKEGRKEMERVIKFDII